MNTAEGAVAYQPPTIVDHGELVELTASQLLATAAQYAQFGASFAASMVLPLDPGDPQHIESTESHSLPFTGLAVGIVAGVGLTLSSVGKWLRRKLRD